MLSYRIGDAPGTDPGQETPGATTVHGKYLPSPPNDGRLWVMACGIVERVPSEIYTLWRDVESTPLWRAHLHEVRLTGETTSHWTMGRGARKLEWECEIVEDLPGKRIAWRSKQSDCDISDEVQFEPDEPKTGTVVTVVRQFGRNKSSTAWEILTGRNPKQALIDDLRNFKTLVETGVALRPYPRKRRIGTLVDRLQESLSQT
jgi:uncharacterized membrane protein